MTDLERVRDLLRRLQARDFPMDGTIAIPGIEELDAHLKEDAELLSELQGAWSTRLVEAEAELARLREALERIAQMGVVGERVPQGFSTASDIARDALDEEQS